MNLYNIAAATLLLALGTAATAADMSGMKMDDMPMQSSAAAPVARAEGTIRAVDPEHGTVTLAHGAVPALQWPPMTMPFKATASQLEGLAVGDKVNFDFRNEGGSASIVNIRKQ